MMTTSRYGYTEEVKMYSNHTNQVLRVSHLFCNSIRKFEILDYVLRDPDPSITTRLLS